jgi:hypothetical protein
MTIAGELVTEELEYDGGPRQVTVYGPPDSPEAVVFAGDGHTKSARPSSGRSATTCWRTRRPLLANHNHFGGE